MSNSGPASVDGVEVALLVEHRVVRQQLLAVDAEHPAVRADRRRVVEVTARLREADHRRAAPGAGRELVERLGRLRDERRPQQQVLGRVAGDRQLGEDDEIAARGLRLLVGVEDPLGVAVEVADDDVDLGGSAVPRSRSHSRSWPGHARTA